MYLEKTPTNTPLELHLQKEPAKHRQVRKSWLEWLWPRRDDNRRDGILRMQEPEKPKVPWGW